MAVTRKEQIANGQKIAPLTREELRLAGKSFAPLTEEEVFQKAAYSGGTKVEGEISIESNGEHDVAQYATANVSVPASAVVSGTKNITSNGDNIDVTNYEKVNVNVPDVQTKSVTINVDTSGGSLYCLNKYGRTYPGGPPLFQTIWNSGQITSTSPYDYERAVANGSVLDYRNVANWNNHGTNVRVLSDIVIFGVENNKTLEFVAESSNGDATLLGTFTKNTGVVENCYVYLISSKKGNTNYDNPTLSFKVLQQEI